MSRQYGAPSCAVFSRKNRPSALGATVQRCPVLGSQGGICSRLLPLAPTTSRHCDGPVSRLRSMASVVEPVCGDRESCCAAPVSDGGAGRAGAAATGGSAAGGGAAGRVFVGGCCATR